MPSQFFERTKVDLWFQGSIDSNAQSLFLVSRQSISTLRTDYDHIYNIFQIPNTAPEMIIENIDETHLQYCRMDIGGETERTRLHRGFCTVFGRLDLPQSRNNVRSVIQYTCIRCQVLEVDIRYYTLLLVWENVQRRSDWGS